VTSAGIHADGLLKNEEIYNIFDTARILDRPLGITVNDRSGLAGIAYWVNTTLGLKGAAQVRKDDARVAAIHREVERQYQARRSGRAAIVASPPPAPADSGRRGPRPRLGERRRGPDSRQADVLDREDGARQRGRDRRGQPRSLRGAEGQPAASGAQLPRLQDGQGHRRQARPGPQGLGIYV